MRILLIFIILSFLFSCGNSAQQTAINDTLISASPVIVTDTLLDDTTWYARYKSHYDNVSFMSLEDTFLKKVLESYYNIDDTKTFPDYTCKVKLCRKEHLSDYKVDVKSKPFDSTKHQLIYTKSHYLYLIDGKIFWGSDGNIPMDQIESFSVKYKGTDISIPRNEYNDLYNQLNSSPQKIHFVDGKNDCVVVLMNCSDGAGSYTVSWIFINGKYIRRVIDSFC